MTKTSVSDFPACAERGNGQEDDVAKDLGHVNVEGSAAYHGPRTCVVQYPKPQPEHGQCPNLQREQIERGQCSKLQENGHGARILLTPTHCSLTRTLFRPLFS